MGRILPTPLEGFTWNELRSMSCVTKVHACMPVSCFWSIGASVRHLRFLDLSGVNELQREVLGETQGRLARAPLPPARGSPRDAAMH